MRTKRSRCHAVSLFLAVLITWPGSMVAAQAQREPWPRIHIPDPLARRITIAALEAASARLADDDCSKIFTDFADGSGRSLGDRLSALAVDHHAYLKMVTFIDDTRHRLCGSGILALTVPGGRVVRVCIDELKRIHAVQPEYVVASLIHEILHTLGLGENPPSSREITKRVLGRCGRK